MINLLPTDVKQNYLFARRNRQLLRWSICLLIGIIGIAIIITAGQLYIQQSIKTYTAQVNNSEQQLKVHKLEDSQKQVEDITNNLKLVVQVLSREIMFSVMIQKIGAAMPPGAVLTSLAINNTQGGLDLGASATNYQTATQIQVNLADPKNQVFEKADINQINCSQSTATGTTAAAYPCDIQIRALFGTNNPYLFINNAKSGT